MNCPYCHKGINAWTGLQEAKKLQTHLYKCRKNPRNVVLTDGKCTVVAAGGGQGLLEALEVRAKSGQ